MWHSVTTAPMRSVRFLVLLAAGFVLSIGSLLAHSVQPMRFDLAPSGPGAQTTMTIDNTRTFPVTLEILAHELTLDEEGQEVLTPADDDFLIFPPQMLIDPGKSQSVRVQYIGDPTIRTSKAYRIIVAQIPVDMSGSQQAGVAITVNFATLANVVPSGAEPKLTASARPDGDALLVDVANEGSAYARLLASEWTLRSGGEERTFSGDDVNAWLAGASNLVLPGTTRQVTVPLPDGFDPASTQVSIALL